MCPAISFLFPYDCLSAAAGQLVIDSSESLYAGDAERVQDRGASFYRTSVCEASSECLPLSECTYLMQYQAARMCLTGDRSMSCGSTSVEPYVCCPRGKLAQEGQQACGKSLVSGQFYKGLGSFPFVARIGFKSECGRAASWACACDEQQHILSHLYRFEIGQYHVSVWRFDSVATHRIDGGPLCAREGRRSSFVSILHRCACSSFVT